MKRNCVKVRVTARFLCLFLFFTLGLGCNTSSLDGKPREKPDSVVIMTWNLQALFDDVEDGTEYAEYAESAGWTTEKYRGRLNVIAGAVGGMGRKPDVIALQEIESARVVTDLAEVLSAQGYGWTHFAVIPGMSLGVGLLSRFPLSDAKAHSVYADGTLTPRPMLEAKISVPAGTVPAGAKESEEDSLPFVLFVCHWKSKLGGEDATESTRRASARIIIRRVRELAESDPDLPVIVTGDLNENHDEFYRRSGEVISALLPDDPRSAELAGLYGTGKNSPNIGELQKDFIILSKSKPPSTRYFPSGAVTLYSPWASELQDGTFYYKNSWETIDHFLLSAQLFHGTGWNFDTCTVVNDPPFANAGGYPASYNPRTGNGLSDHLPLLLVLKVK